MPCLLGSSMLRTGAVPNERKSSFFLFLFLLKHYISVLRAAAQVVESMSPVWLEQQQFEYIGELGEVWLEVQHREQVRPHQRSTTPVALFHLRTRHNIPQKFRTYLSKCT